MSQVCGDICTVQPESWFKQCARNDMTSSSCSACWDVPCRGSRESPGFADLHISPPSNRANDGLAMENSLSASRFGPHGMEIGGSACAAARPRLEQNLSVAHHLPSHISMRLGR
ncbi:hypothetical protein K505DRAFT_335718 [Melanomma pulvis-pyrius CBS 109.77]|uniref:Uncharacterized protein n=1 Tax=Melanomma pulvis-pyrius CBS 109.77 TaxID=1314802 RepID=A0A6A6XHF8_9PLEO|nr:hypothetical protein K505DRAFT_335718 [Melanomma pulvis-pyrius CBS 109.77]